MNNAQKAVLTELIVIFFLKFGIATKIGQLWNLAFSGTAVTSGAESLGKA